MTLLKNTLLASIDIGTHSAQLLIAQKVREQIIPKLDKIASVRLGEGLKNGGTLIHQDSLARLKKALILFRQTLNNVGAQLKVVVLTEASRKAQNSEDVLALIQKELGLKAHILSGPLEAELCWTSIYHLYQNTSFVMTDIGAGSFEISNGQDHFSFPMGALSLAQEYGPIPSDTLHKILIKDFKKLELKIFQKKPLFLSGGTAAALGALLLDLKEYSPEALEGLEITFEQIDQTITRLSQISADLRVQLPGLEEGRSEIIIPGLFLLRAIVQTLQPSQIRMSVQGLRLGALVKASLAAEFTPSDSTFQ